MWSSLEQGTAKFVNTDVLLKEVSLWIPSTTILIPQLYIKQQVWERCWVWCCFLGWLPKLGAARPHWCHGTTAASCAFSEHLSSEVLRFQRVGGWGLWWVTLFCFGKSLEYLLQWCIQRGSKMPNSCHNWMFHSTFCALLGKYKPETWRVPGSLWMQTESVFNSSLVLGCK